MPSSERYDLRLFAEGVRVPCINVTRQQQIGQPTSFSVELPPYAAAFRVLPGTFFQVFFREGGEEAEFKLFCEGRVVNREMSTAADGQRRFNITCVDLSAEWSKVYLGLNVGQDINVPRMNTLQFFYGLSTTDEGADSILAEGFAASRGSAFIEALQQSAGNDARFLEPYQVVLRLLDQYGPVQGLAQIMADLPFVSPLYRQVSRALRLEKRLGYVENRKITNYLVQDNFVNLLSRRIEALGSDATFMDLLSMSLPQTFHHTTPLPSAPYREKRPSPLAEEMLTVDKIEAGPNLYDSSLSGSSSARELYNDPRINAFLDVIAQAEVGTTDRTPDAYKTIVGGRKMAGLEGHPNQQVFIERIGQNSTAAGRYQFLKGTWDEYAPVAGVQDFSAESQDLVAIELIRRRGAIDDILNGNIDNAIKKSGNEWAGLPTNDTGRGRYENQETNAALAGTGTPRVFRTLFNVYNERVGYWHEELDANGKPPRVNFTTSRIQLFPELTTTLVKPQLQFAPPPACNVILPYQVRRASVSENFVATPTRLLMKAMTTGSAAAGPRVASNLQTPLHFAPRQIQYVVDALRSNTGNPFFSDIQNEEAVLREKDLVRRFKEYERGLEPEEAETTNQLMWQSAGLQGFDALSSILEADTSAPSNILSLFSKEEILRGINPALGSFPFYSNSSAEEAGESELVSKIQARYANDDSAQADFYRQQVANSDELAAVNIYANYRYSMMRRQGRTLEAGLSFSPHLACGFTGAFYQAHTGWVQGEIVSIVDSIDGNANTANTSIQMRGCAFLNDMEDPTWRSIYRNADGDGTFLDDDDIPENPIFYSDELSANAIGENVYQELLQCPSINDLFGSSSKEAYDIIINQYNQQDDPRGWAMKRFRRPIASEEEVMVNFLGATPEGSGDGMPNRYGGTYSIQEIPDNDGPSFMAERRVWAENILRKYILSAATINMNGEASLFD